MSFDITKDLRNILSTLMEYYIAYFAMRDFLKRKGLWDEYIEERQRAESE